MCIHIVGQSHHFEHPERAKNTNGQGKKYGQRQYKAFVLDRQHQVDEKHNNQRDNDKLIASFRFVEGQVFPCNVEVAGQGLLSHLADSLNGFARGITFGRKSPNGGRVVHVVARDFVGPFGFFQGHKRRVGHHIAFVIFDKQGLQIIQISSVLRGCLGKDFEKPAEFDEALLVRAAHQNIQVVHGRFDGNPFLHGRLVIDLDFSLRVGRVVEGKQTRNLFALFQGFHKLLSGRFQLRIAEIAGFIQ